ncbi:MAG: VOC family protein, partial [Acidobacteria bacterium]|nr:VOC family protein [Acidobacteriota bacterium]
MLGACKIMAFVGTKDPARAMAFYRDTLGLHLAEETPFALVFDANGVTLRVSIVREVVAA